MSATRRGAHGPVEASPDGITLQVRVVTRSSRSAVDGVQDGALRVRLNAPPVDGAANEELTTVVARALGVPRSAVTLVAGQRSRTKRLVVRGLSPADAIARLGLD